LVIDANDFGLVLGEILGAAMFITTFENSQIILKSVNLNHSFNCRVILGSVLLINNSGVDKKPFLRDSLTYVVSVVVVLIISLNEEITLEESVGFLCLYVAYVGYVIYNVYYGEDSIETKKNAITGSNQSDIEEVLIQSEDQSNEISLYDSSSNGKEEVDDGSFIPSASFNHISHLMEDEKEKSQHSKSDDKLEVEQENNFRTLSSPLISNNLIGYQGKGPYGDGGEDDDEKSVDRYGYSISIPDARTSYMRGSFAIMPPDVYLGITWPTKDENSEVDRDDIMELLKDDEEEDDDLGSERSESNAETESEEGSSEHKSSSSSQHHSQLTTSTIMKRISENEKQDWIDEFLFKVEVVQYVCEFPFSILRHLTICECRDYLWNKERRYLSSLSLLFSPLFLLLTISGWDGFVIEIAKFDDTSFYMWHLLLGAGLICFAISVFLTNDFTKPSFFSFFLFLGFCNTVAWLYIVANECVALLESIGLILDIPTPVLGLTVLAWGNSVGDFVSDTSVAKAGSPKMAIATCFGSPLLTILLGLGLSLIITTINDGNLTFNLPKTLIFSYIALFASLFSSILIYVKYGFKQIPKFHIYWLFFLYLVFFVVNLVITLT